MREEGLERSLKELKYLIAIKLGRFAKETKKKWTGSQRKLRRPGCYEKQRKRIL